MAKMCSRVCSEFGEDRGTKLNTVYLTQIIHKTHRNVDFCGLLLKQTQTRPAVVPERKQTRGMHLICGKKSAVIPCNMCRRKLSCTAVNGSVSAECTTDRLCFVPERKQTTGMQALNYNVLQYA